jgi:hypothetical protein
MVAYDNTIKSHVRFDNRGYQPRRSSLNLAHVKFDLLKVSELYDGVLTEELAMLPVRMYELYLNDLVSSNMIHEFRIEAPELRVNEETGSRSFTYTFHVQGTADRTAKVLKIHVGLYRSVWMTPTRHTADGRCCMPNRLDRDLEGSDA